MNKTKLFVTLLTCVVAVACTRKSSEKASSAAAPKQLGYSAEEMDLIRKNLGGVRDNGTGDCAPSVASDFEKSVSEINSAVNEIRDDRESINVDLAKKGSAEDLAHVAKIFQENANALSGLVNKCRAIIADHALVKCQEAHVQQVIKRVDLECDRIEAFQEETQTLSSEIAAHIAGSEVSDKSR